MEQIDYRGMSMVDKRKKEDTTVKAILIHVTLDEFEKLDKYKNRKGKKLSWKQLLFKGMDDS